MKNIFILFFILCLTKIGILPEMVYSQNDSTFSHSISIGVELFYPARMIIEPEIKQLEASMDFEFTERWFVAIEGGLYNTDIERDNFNYFTDGHFFRAGINFNILNPDVIDAKDMVYIGLRYGYSAQEHGAGRIVINDDYWGNYNPPDERADFESQWLELVAGLKTELFTNFFIGWSIRYRILLSKTDDALIKPYRISGFGRGDSNTAVDLNYSLYYRISF